MIFEIALVELYQIEWCNINVEEKYVSTFACLMVPWSYKNVYLNATFYVITVYILTVITTTAANTNNDEQNEP